MAGEIGEGRLRRAGGSAQGKTERPAHSVGDDREGAWTLQGNVLRPEYQHFHEKLRDEHSIDLSYTWVQKALQGAGLVAKRHKRGPHRRRRHDGRCPGCCCTLTAANIAG